MRRDHVCELDLEKGDGNVNHLDGQVLDEALSSGFLNVPAGAGALPCGLCSLVKGNLPVCELTNDPH